MSTKPDFRYPSEDRDRHDRLQLQLGNYNKEYHRDLLTRSNKLRFCNRYHGTEEALKLAMFTRFFDGALQWKYRSWYLKLINDFLSNELALYDFCQKFFNKSIFIFDEMDFLESKLEIDLDEGPDVKSFDFSQLVEQINNFAEYYWYNPELYSRDDQEEFRQSVQQYYLEILLIISKSE